MLYHDNDKEVKMRLRVKRRRANKRLFRLLIWKK